MTKIKDDLERFIKEHMEGSDPMERLEGGLSGVPIQAQGFHVGMVQDTNPVTHLRDQVPKCGLVMDDLEGHVLIIHMEPQEIVDWYRSVKPVVDAFEAYTQGDPEPLLQLQQAQGPLLDEMGQPTHNKGLDIALPRYN